MTTPNATTSFDRREFLKASGVLVIGFSMGSAPGSARATTLRAPKSVAKEAIDSWLTISPDNPSRSSWARWILARALEPR